MTPDLTADAIRAMVAAPVNRPAVHAVEHYDRRSRAAFPDGGVRARAALMRARAAEITDPAPIDDWT